MKSVQLNSPNFSYIAQASVPGMGHLLNFRIDQSLSNPGDRRQQQANCNLVEAHLHDLSKRTGLSYSLLYWASPERVDDYIVANGLKVD